MAATTFSWERPMAAMAAPCRIVALMLATLIALAPAARAERAAVLGQVALPHAYYWRELYLPQLTSGPSAVAFLPDGGSVVYSMGGSLWKQAIGSESAEELTAGPGYDYQPDVSRDGRRVVFARQRDNAIEIVERDLASGREQAVTTDGAAAVEPRYAPDGERIAFVSTRETGRFGIWLATREAGGGFALRRLVQESISTLNRYYYLPQDHAINPAWSPDGRTLYFVSNRGVAWGSGDIWSIDVANPAEWRHVLREETTWSARPDIAPDGRRVLYSSYHGRDWHQLWLTTAQGDSPLPLTFGDFDRRNARWSPDGTRIAYISNERGNTSLWVQESVGGERREIVAREKRWLRPMGSLQVRLRDATGQPLSARVSVLAADGRHYAPDDVWMRADDGFERPQQDHETHYFHCAGDCTVEAPAGRVALTVWSGMEREIETRALRLGRAGASVEIVPRANALPAEFGAWTSLDQHVHMNYGGHYRSDQRTLAAAAHAEDLDVLYDLVVNKEQRVPGVLDFSPQPRTLDGVTIVTAQEFHTSYWGHLGLLHLDDHLLLPDFSAYRHTALSSPWPHNGEVAALARRQHALVGYVHPFDWPIRPVTEKSLSNALPADVAHGAVDYLEIVSFADHRSTAEVWHRLLNLGFHLPAGAGTDAMANYASLRGPVGLNRVFLNQSARDVEALKDGIRGGKGFVTNGPLLGLRVDGTAPGGTVKLGAARAVSVRAALRSAVPVDHVEILVNGEVVRTLRARAGKYLDWEGSIAVPGSGWLLLRAWGPSQAQLFDIYPYATTNPVWIETDAGPQRAPADAAYFIQWIDRVKADAGARDDFNSEAERSATLEYLEQARRRFEEAR